MHTACSIFSAEVQLMVMKPMTYSLSELVLLAGTRVALGVGIGLLLAGRLDRRARVGAGRALAAVGVLTTIPLVVGMIRRRGGGERGPRGPSRGASEVYTGADVP